MKLIQEQVKAFCEKNNLTHNPKNNFIDLISELGEVGKELLKNSEYGHAELRINEELKEELGDAFYSLITLANSVKVDLTTELKKTLNKYEKRLTKGSAGSEVDKE